MTSGQHIDYDALTLAAQRGVVKACLEQVSRTGLPGEHHFYIAFNTQAPGVGMSKRLKQKYPLEMTIVLQHRFWDLAVTDERFEVKLTFDGIPERLVVPFAAVKVFYDPSVPYILQFEDFVPIPDAPKIGEKPAVEPPKALVPSEPGLLPDKAERAEGSEARRSPRKTRGESGDSEAGPGAVAAASADKQEGQAERDPARRDAKPGATSPAVAATGGSKPSIVAVGKSDGHGSERDDEAEASEAGDEASGEPGGAKIFDLSKFRGKK